MANVSDWLQELTDHGFEDTTDTRKLVTINDTIADLCSREPWPFLQKTIQLSFDGSSGKASNFPADFRAQLTLTDPSTGRTINWERADVLRKRNASQWGLVSTPVNFYDEAGLIRVYPIPTSGYKLDSLYLCTHPTVDASTVEAAILVPARHARVIPVGSLAKLYAMEDDPENSAAFKQEYEGRIATMREDISRIQYDRPDRIWVTDDDDYDTYFGVF